MTTPTMEDHIVADTAAYIRDLNVAADAARDIDEMKALAQRYWKAAAKIEALECNVPDFSGSQKWAAMHAELSNAGAELDVRFWQAGFDGIPTAAGAEAVQ